MYKTYVSAISQSGSSTPSATELENTYSSPVSWGRINPGIYVISSELAFYFQNKIYISGFSLRESGSVGAKSGFPILDEYGLLVGYYYFEYLDSDTMYFKIVNTFGRHVELSKLIGDTVLYLPEIKIYP